MSSSNNRILSIYNSRKNLIDILENLEYDITEHSDFTINEIDAMFSKSQLDFLVEKKGDGDEKRKLYVRYYSSKQIRPATLSEIIEDLMDIEQILTKQDTIMIVIDEEPNDTILAKIRHLYDNEGIFIVIHNINRLQYNLLKHTLVPEAHVCSPTEIETLKEKYNIVDVKKLPEISRFDPQALVLCLRPGDICCFKRKSQTSMFSNFYRICV
jgi:DNA-directed RNA polymerase subunit H (RpoH/RPB5)